MADIIISKIEIAILGARELRQTELNGELKFDIREWHGDKYESGVRLTIDELNEIRNDSENIGNKTLTLENGEYIVSVVMNERLYKRVLCSEDEMKELKNVLNSVNPFTEDGLIKYKAPIKTKKAKTKTGTVLEVLNTDKTEDNIYEKFSKMFEDFRNNQPENRRAAFKSTHDIVLEHIKSVMETSEDYNKDGMHPCKNSRDMMSYVMEKAYENYDATHDYEEAKALICGWVDEYIGLKSDVAEWEKKQKEQAKADAKRKKEQKEKEKKMKELEPKALEELKKDKKYNDADDKKKASMLKAKVTTLYHSSLAKAKEDKGDDE